MLVEIKYFKSNSQTRASQKREMNKFHLVNSLWAHKDEYEKVEIILDDIISITRNMTWKTKRACQSDVYKFLRENGVA